VLRRVLLPTIFVLLGYGFWVSPDIKEIAAGVAIFLFGMLALEEGFRAFTGGVLERVLQRTTNTLWKSLSFGVVTTTLMQSSSLVSVITISFLSAGLIGLAAGIGIIFGANLGTTTGAWLVAGFGLKVKISAYAMPMLVFGVILIFQRPKTLKGIGYVLAGLGFLFLGIHHMKEGFEAFKETIDLSQFSVPGFRGLLLFAGIGIFATVVMQSSHATLVLIITALAAGQISYENALALAIGANVGTTITAVIGALSANEQGRRLAGAHLIFNVVTGLIAIGLIAEFVVAVDAVSNFVGIAAKDFTLKLAVFHTLFNLVGVLVMIPFINLLVRLLERLIPRREVGRSEPRYLNDAAVDFPETALQAVRQETLALYDATTRIILRGLELDPDRAVLAGAPAPPPRRMPGEYDIQDAYERDIKGIYSAIIAFISKAAFSWEASESGSLHWIRAANLSLAEAIKDTKHLRSNLILFLASRNTAIRDEYNEIRRYLAGVIQSLNKTRDTEDPDVALLSLDQLKASIDEFDDALNHRLVSLLRTDAITPAMGTSLMNDSAYVHDVARHLLRAGETLFTASGRDLTSAARRIQLDESELAEAMEQAEETTTGIRKAGAHAADKTVDTMG
jgi:phosphate:Na+ symporter